MTVGSCTLSKAWTCILRLDRERDVETMANFPLSILVRANYSRILLHSSKVLIAFVAAVVTTNLPATEQNERGASLVTSVGLLLTHFPKT